jgi:proteasome lid subunit RPN8/RPN11
MSEATLTIRQAAFDDLVAHAREDAPNECCGMLVGRDRCVERVARARNRLGSPTRFLIDPRDQIAAFKAARAAGQTIVGYYHSHPSSSPEPSETDRREVPSGECHVIVSPGFAGGPPDIRAYLLPSPGNFLPLAVVPLP